MKKYYLLYIFFTLLLIIPKNLVINKAYWKNLINSKSIIYQLQLVINNKTTDINGNPIGYADGFIAWFYLDLSIFYLDLSINGKSYNATDFQKSPSFHRSVKDFDGESIQAYYPDIFWTNINAIKSTNTICINFTFGIFDVFHYQNTCANNYLYNFYKAYFDTKSNGAKLIINSYGGWGSNTANWGFQYYKF